MYRECLQVLTQLIKMTKMLDRIPRVNCSTYVGESIFLLFTKFFLEGISIELNQDINRLRINLILIVLRAR